MTMSKITLVLVFVIMSFSSNAQATKWASEGKVFQQKAGVNIPVEKPQCDCLKAEEIKDEFTENNDAEILRVIKSGSEEDLSKLIQVYDQKSSDYASKNIFGELFYKSIALMLIKNYAIRFPENFQEGFLLSLEFQALENEIAKILNSLEELEKQCSSKISGN